MAYLFSLPIGSNSIAPHHSSEASPGPKAGFILLPGQFWALILHPVLKPVFLRAGKLPWQIIEPVQCNPLRLFLRRQLGAGLTDVGRVALSGEFFVGLYSMQTLQQCPCLFISVLPRRLLGRRFFPLIVVHRAAVVNHAWLPQPAVLQPRF